MVNNPRYVLLIFQLEFQKKKRLYDNSSVPSDSFGIFRSVVSTPIIRAARCYVVQCLNYCNPSRPKIHLQILQLIFLHFL